jgi:hypothetical protein
LIAELEERGLKHTDEYKMSKDEYFSMLRRSVFPSTPSSSSIANERRDMPSTSTYSSLDLNNEDDNEEEEEEDVWQNIV